MGRLVWDLQTLLRNPLFIVVLLIKVLASIAFASDFLTDYFVPFVTHAASTLTDPYVAFVQQGFIDAFPYPPLMLLLLAIPKGISLLFGLGGANLFDLFILRLPLLIADIGILLIFLRLLPDRRNDVIRYYWAAPVLFYISYVHGQLDVIPILFVLASVALLFWRKPYAPYLAFAVFGAGLATKTSVLLAFPFLLMYLWKQTRSIREVGMCAIISGGVFGIFTLPFLTDAFIQMVFLSEQQGKLFAFSFPFYSGLVLFLAPIAYLTLFFRFAGYKRITPDALMMILSLVFAIFMILVPPRPGWFFWGLPFIIYFFVRFDSLRRFTYWALNGAYFLFFWTWKDGDFPQFFQPLFPALGNDPNLYARFLAMGLPADVISSIMFSLLAAIVLVIAYWIYRFGIRRNDEYYIRNKPISIGIGGDSGSGKTTLSELLRQSFGSKNVLVVNGDDVHRWERGNSNWQKLTQLDPAGNRLHLDYQQALKLANGRSVLRQMYDHNTGKFTAPVKLEPTRFLLFTGLHPFYLKGMRDMLDLRLFLKPDEAVRKGWKVLRDKKERGYTKASVVRSLNKRRPDSAKFIKPQADFANIVISFKSHRNSQLDLHLRLDNSIDTERIQNALSSISTLRISQHYDKDCEHQWLTFSGTASAPQILRALRTLAPDYDLILAHQPKFADGLNGILQLMIIFQISEISKQVASND